MCAKTIQCECIFWCVRSKAHTYREGIETLDLRRDICLAPPPCLAPDETVAVILLSLSCLLSLHCPAYCHLLPSTAIYCRYCHYCKPLPAVSTGRHYFKIIW